MRSNGKRSIPSMDDIDGIVPDFYEIFNNEKIKRDAQTRVRAPQFLTHKSSATTIAHNLLRGKYL